MEKFEDNLTFEDIINQTFKKVKVGSTITGTIVEINVKGEIFVDIGYKADGIIPRNEYFSEKDLEPAEEYKVGDKIKADVLKLNDGQGNVLMSCKHEKIKEIRKEFKEKVDNKEVFEEEVKQTNKNGLVVLYKNLIRVFIPISLSEVGRDEDVSSYKGKTIRFRVIENDERAKKIIGSVKDLVEEEKKAKEEEFWNNIEVGKKYTGTVTAISDYGAFVDIGGAQGLLHISEMTWGRNQNPRDILEVGQSIEVSVKELDKENKRFKLSYEKKGPNPWNKVEEKYHVGDVVKVKISKIMPFGAFAELEKGTITPQKQGESTTEYAKMLNKKSGEIDWTKTAVEIERLIRGLNPWPSAFTFINGKTLKVWRSSVEKAEVKETPGTVMSADKEGIHVACGQDVLVLREVQLEGKKRMEADAFLRGCQLKPGDMFTDSRE